MMCFALELMGPYSNKSFANLHWTLQHPWMVVYTHTVTHNLSVTATLQPSRALNLVTESVLEVKS